MLRLRRPVSAPHDRRNANLRPADFVDDKQAKRNTESPR
jgi:hypothetical protein